MSKQKIEHSSRLMDPEQFGELNRQNKAEKVGGKYVDHVYGINDKGSPELQAVLYPIAEGWTRAEALDHSNEIEGIFVEAAPKKRGLGRAEIDGINSELWALHPGALEDLQNLTLAYLRNDKTVDAQKLEAFLDMDDDDQGPGYEVEDGIAFIPVSGILQRRVSFLAFLFGATSTETIKKDIMAALEDPAVEGIVLDIDSPGGSVHGAKELADLIYSSRATKPISAFSGGTMASAAYWIGSAADKVVAYDTAIVGSIGVAVTHFDLSEQDKKLGVKRTVISAGKYKRLVSDEKPLSDEGKKLLQNLVDTYYDIFIGAVAEQRGVSVEVAEEKMGDGRDFVGVQALEAGLIDEVGTIETTTQITKGAQDMDKQTLQEKHPELFKEVFTLGAESVNVEDLRAQDQTDFAAKAEEIRAEGVKEERARVIEIAEVTGPEGVKLEAIKEGLEVKDALKLILERDQKERDDKLAALKNDASPAVGTDVQVEEHKETAPVADLDKAARDEWEKSQDLQSEFKTVESYIAFKKADAKGLVRVKKS